MKNRNIIIAIALIIFASCEDVIEIDLSSIEPKLVIEATISDKQEPYTIKLTKSGDYFEPGIYPAVSNASVVISDNIGNTETLQEVENGIYQTVNMQGEIGITYTLNVLSEGIEYTAESLMPEKVNIDSLSYEFVEATPRFDEGYMVNCHFADPLETKNYYRFKTYLNGELLNSSSDIYIRDDKMFNGNEVKIPLLTEIYSFNDTITIELLSLNKETYDYFNTLINIIGGNSEGGPMGGGGPMAGSTPANPETNLSNGAMGYFGAFTVSSETIIIK
ncbi:MAG: DUF4249 domain-containing protein [Bacteroidales bacterium]|nr:DUF4249 domain-containing protein [Bacteroidales bacterium]